jgi:hypothetical protein
MSDRARALRVEDVGRAVVTLCLDEQREVGRVAVAHVDLDPGLLAEPLENRTDELLRSSRVDGQTLAATTRARAGEQRHPERERREPHVHADDGSHSTDDM